jgi:hypothetical protein
MKPKTIAAILFAGVMTLLTPRPMSAAWSVSITYFHQELAPYGRWVYASGYGEVWYPTAVRAGWAPYVDGEWIYTDCGWTWVSYDPFGDPFHYGTWVWLDPYGWCWEPGYVWAPAWVTWAWTDGYIGWAPLPPTFAITASGYSGGAVTVAQNRYVFVPINRFAGTNVSTVRVASTQNSTILARAQRATRFSVAGGVVHTGGPPTALVERATGRPLRAVSVSSHKLKPTTISAGGVRSGRRIPLVAPANERAAAMNAAKERKSTAPKVAHRAAPQPSLSQKETAASRHLERPKPSARVAKIENRAPTRQAAAPRHKAKIEKQAPPRQAVAARHEARPARQSAEKPSTFAARQPPRQVHREKTSGAPPPSSVERRHEASPPPAVREERRTAMNRVAEPPRPPRHEAPPSQAPQPRAAQPRPGPPPAAAARPPEHPQPKGQPGGNKKEKPQR